MKSKLFKPIAQKFYFTQEGYQKLKQDCEELLKSRPDALEHLKKAREMGDLSENGYYKASKAKLISIDTRLRRLSYMLKRSQIIQAQDNKTVHLGNLVTISDGETEITYMIVGAFEANPSENKISNVSPLGLALLNKKVGDIVKVQTPTRTQDYKIINIE